MLRVSFDKKYSKGIYILPNLFTVSALFAGFYAIIAAIHGRFDLAGMMIFVAMLFDALDGRIARMTHSQSEFGAHMDSLSDMVCFGLSPALVLYLWSLSRLGKIGWLGAFLYMVCSALRLARFNTQAPTSTSNRYFSGLSTTASAGVVGGLIWSAMEMGLPVADYPIALLLFTLLLSALKVSSLPYRSFKDVDMRAHVSFVVILLLVLTMVLICLNPSVALFLIFLLYALSGLTVGLIRGCVSGRLPWRLLPLMSYRLKHESDAADDTE